MISKIPDMARGGDKLTIVVEYQSLVDLGQITNTAIQLRLPVRRNPNVKQSVSNT